MMERLVIASPDNPSLHHLRGIALFDTHDLDGAIACFQKALELDPKFAEAHNHLAGALWRKGRQGEAIEQFQKAIEFNPKYAQAHYNLGSALSDKGRKDEAIEQWQKAIELDPTFAPPHYNLGLALQREGRWMEAIDHYQKAIAFNPKHPEAHCNLGHVLRQQGRFDEALVYLKRGHELGSKTSGWKYPSAQWVRDTERLVALHNWCDCCPRTRFLELPDKTPCRQLTKAYMQLEPRRFQPCN
jgi:tetratricopeptide (TPR) repeat protein